MYHQINYWNYSVILIFWISKKNENWFENQVACELHCWTEERERIIGKLKKLNVQEVGILLYINYIAKQMDVVKEGHLLLKYSNISILSVSSPTSASLCLLLSVHFFISWTASLIACSSSINKDKTRE